MPTSKRYILKTLGCKANLYDSQLIEAELQKRGWLPVTDGNEEASLCIVNSCTVTDEADKQSLKTAHKLSKSNPSASVLFTGCGAEINPTKVAHSPGVHFVVGNQNKNNLVDLALKTIEKKEISNPISHETGEILGSVQDYRDLLSRHLLDREWAIPESTFLLPPVHLLGETGRTRSFIKIQEGCNSFCTYCVIPYGRGPSRSLKIHQIIEQIHRLTEQGIQEVVLTGTNIGDYGTDWEQKDALTQLCLAILEKTNLPRLRVSSLDPTEITQSLLDLMRSDPRFCPHFHVSLQSPHSKTLRMMKRKYDSSQVQECLEKINKMPAPIGGPFIGMDIITGFPGETDQDFEWGYNLLQELPWSRLHVFPYSEREGTPATRLPGGVPLHLRLKRAKILRELSLKRMKSIHIEILEQIKNQNRALQDVLFEGRVKGPESSRIWIAGYTPNYLRVLLPVRSLAEAEKLKNQSLSIAPVSIISDSSAGDVALLAEEKLEN